MRVEFRHGDLCSLAPVTVAFRYGGSPGLIMGAGLKYRRDVRAPSNFSLPRPSSDRLERPVPKIRVRGGNGAPVGATLPLKMNSYPYQDQSLRVGIAGAYSERGSAKEAPVPALQKLSGLELTSGEKSAPAAAECFRSGAQRRGRHRVHLRQGS
jgi:hypothetical protein